MRLKVFLAALVIYSMRRKIIHNGNENLVQEPSLKNKSTVTLTDFFFLGNFEAFESCLISQKFQFLL